MNIQSLLRTVLRDKIIHYNNINGEAYNIKYSSLMIFMSLGGSECVKYN